MPPTRTGREPPSANPARRRFPRPPRSTPRRAPRDIRVAAIDSLISHVDAEPRRVAQRHDDGVPLFAELGVPEDDFVRPDRHRQVPDWRLADLVPVNPDFGPGDRVDGDRAV